VADPEARSRCGCHRGPARDDLPVLHRPGPLRPLDGRVVRARARARRPPAGRLPHRAGRRRPGRGRRGGPAGSSSPGATRATARRSRPAPRPWRSPSSRSPAGPRSGCATPACLRGEPPADHLAGWRHALATLAYAGSAEQLGPVLGERVGDWLAAWNEPDAVRRAELLGRCLADGGRFRDPTTAVDGARQLAEHIGMVQRLTGGARLAGRGAPEACHGLVRFGWTAVGPDQTVLATGTNVAEADLDGRFRWVTGFWTRLRIVPGRLRAAERPAHSSRTAASVRSAGKCDESSRSRQDFAHRHGTRQSLRTRWSQVGPAPRGADDPRSRRPAGSGRISYGERASIGWRQASGPAAPAASDCAAGGRLHPAGPGHRHRRVRVLRQPAGPEPGLPLGRRPLQVVVSPDQAGVCPRRRPSTSGAGRWPTTAASTSGSAARLVGGGGRPLDRLGRGQPGPRPDVWVPASSAWALQVALRQQAASRPVLIPLEYPKVATTPMVMAMPKPMAQALGWPRRTSASRSCSGR
jgi:hypothetical protein